MDERYKNIIEKYCLQDNLLTYDIYDVWKSDFGVYIKALYFKNKKIGLLPASFLTIYDTFFNNKLRLLNKKQEYPVVRAFAALSLMNLYEQFNDNKYLEFTEKHIEWLINNYSVGYGGYCWGANFRIVYGADNVYDKNVPYTTNTPYVLEALIKYYSLTNNNKILQIIKSVFNFFEQDVQTMKENGNMLILSYSTHKDRIVVNANSYSMYSYALLLPFFPERQDYIKNKIQKIYNFIQSTQNKDGSWYYAPYDKNSFIDCFHSCFVIKNIYKTNRILKLENADDVIQKAYNYLQSNMLDPKGLYKRFSVSNKASLIKYDIYDNAEMLNIMLMLNKKEEAKQLNNIIEKYFIRNENIYSQIDIFGRRINKNTLRWAAMPYIYVISKNIDEL